MRVHTLLKSTQGSLHHGCAGPNITRLLDDMTALHLAVNEGHCNVIKILLESEAELEAKTRMGRTPLHIAALRGNLKITELLVSSGANVNTTDTEFATPLHYASEHGYSELVDYLLSHGARASMKNHAGLTALDVALNRSTWNVFETNQMVGQDVRSNFGRTWIDNFLIYNSREDYVAKMLLMNNQIRMVNGDHSLAKLTGTTQHSNERPGEQKTKAHSRIQQIIINCSNKLTTNNHVNSTIEPEQRLNQEVYC